MPATAAAKMIPRIISPFVVRNRGGGSGPYTTFFSLLNLDLLKPMVVSPLSHYPSAACRLYAESMEAFLCRCLTSICRKTSSGALSRRRRKCASNKAGSGQLSNRGDASCLLLVASRKSMDIITIAM